MPTSKLSTTNNQATRTLVIGAGYLGRPLSFHLKRAGHDVVAVTRSLPETPILLGVLFRSCKVDKESYLQMLGEVQPDNIVVCWAPGKNEGEGYEQTYMHSMTALCQACNRFTPKHIVYTSSTSIYENDDGKWVEEVDLAQPNKHNQRILHQAEQQLLISTKQSGIKSTILRLSGLYGPERIPGLRRLRVGEPVRGHGNTWTNLIHRDDAIRAIERCFATGKTGIYNITDDAHHLRKDLYHSIAEVTGHDEITWSEKESASSKGKKISAQKAHDELGWVLRHPDHKEWILEYLKNHKN